MTALATDTYHIWTWNVNSIKNKVEFVNALLQKHDIDILVLTETKIKQEDEALIQVNKSYKCVWNSNKNSRFHGTVLIHKTSIKVETLETVLPQAKSYSLPELSNTKNIDVINKYFGDVHANVAQGHMTEGRLLTVKCEFGKKTVIIVGTYVPNAGVNRNTPFKRLAYRVTAWDRDLYAFLLNLQERYEHVIWLGDLNVVMKDNDVYYPKANMAGTTIEERRNIKHFMDTHQWVDTWDHCNPDRVKCKDRATYGIGTRCLLRLDYVICTKSLEDCIIASNVDQLYQGSDHVPIGTIFRF